MFKNEEINFDKITARAHRYPDPDPDKYVDTTQYNENDNWFDISYQNFKKISIRSYPEFKILKKLFIDHNILKSLPDPMFLPNMEHLNCSNNELETIPFYPKLTYLNCSHNKLTTLEGYDNSRLIYLDCSFNKYINVPKCKNLNSFYLSDCFLNRIDLSYYSKLEILDCSNNELRELLNLEKCSKTLLELSIQNNKISALCQLPRLLYLDIENNRFEKIITYPNILSISANQNNIKIIDTQPLLRKLFVSHNQISFLGTMPKLKLIDLSYNNLQTINIPSGIKYALIHFNPLKDISKIRFGSKFLDSVKELHLSFDTYSIIYHKFYKEIDSISVQIHEIRLKYLLKNLCKILDDNIVNYIFKKFCGLKFQQRDEGILKVAVKIYWDLFHNTKIKTIEELLKSDEFSILFESMTKVYLKAIVFTLYFNGGNIMDQMKNLKTE